VIRLVQEQGFEIDPPALRRENGCPLDHVGELAHVARPLVATERFEIPRRQTE